MVHKDDLITLSPYDDTLGIAFSCRGRDDVLFAVARRESHRWTTPYTYSLFRAFEHDEEGSIIVEHMESYDSDYWDAVSTADWLATRPGV